MSKLASCLLLAMAQTTQLTPGTAHLLAAAIWALTQQKTRLEAELAIQGFCDQLVG